MFLTFDLGATSLRAGLVDARGHVVARHAAVTAGLDPELWWRDLQAAASAVLDAKPGPVTAIAISALTRTQVMVDRHGNALGNAIGFADTRALSIVPDLVARLPADDAETAGVNAFHPLARLDWLAHHEPTWMARAAHVLDPKDYLNARLTGVIASDAISLARLVASQARLFAATGLDARLVPPLRAPLSIVGRVRPGMDGAFAGLAGVPVVTMAHDTWASVLGLGAMRAGTAYNLSGTSEVFGVCTDRPVTAPGLLTVDWGKGVIQIGGPSLAGGDTVRWLRDILAFHGDLGDLVNEAGDATPPLLFLPYLSGERVPHWDADLRGAWIGLDRRHGPADLARATLEGVAHLNRLVLARAETAVGSSVHEVRFGGGGAVNAVWCQIKADVMDRPVLITACEDHGLLGAAIAARAALGGDVFALQAEMVQVVRTFKPQRAARARSERMHQLYEQADIAVAPLSRALAAMGRSP